MEYTVIIPLFIGYFLDLIWGDPRGLPHPIRLFGNCIAWGEKKLNISPFKLVKGMVLTLVLVTAVALFFYYSQQALRFYPIAYFIFSSVFVFYALANKSLIDEGKAVFNALQQGLDQGR